MEYWKKLNSDMTISTVESHSYPHKVPRGIKITKEEYDDFIASLPPPIPPNPPRDLAAKLDDHEARIKDLEAEA